MNFKIVLAAALLITGGSYISSAQQKATTATAAVSDSKAFNAKIAAFEKATDKTKSTVLLGELKQQMLTGLSGAKEKVVAAQNAGNDAAATKAQQLIQTRSELYNKVVQLTKANPDNKAAIVEVLKQYSKSL